MRMKVPAWAHAVFPLALAALPVHAGELLHAEGHVFRWGKPQGGQTTVITYAIVKDHYAVPGGKSILSPENCGSMHAFAAIVSQSPGLTATSAQEQLELAFKTWEAITAIQFMLIEDPHQANIVIGAADGPTGRAFANLSYRKGSGEQPVAKALGKSSDEIANAGPTSSAPDTFAEIDQAYVCLNARLPWKTGFDGNLQVYDLKYTFTHEIGHAIGLDHPGKTGAVMAYRYDETVNGLGPIDVAAVQSIYGRKLQN